MDAAVGLGPKPEEWRTLGDYRGLTGLLAGRGAASPGCMPLLAEHAANWDGGRAWYGPAWSLQQTPLFSPRSRLEVAGELAMPRGPLPAPRDARHPARGSVEAHENRAGEEARRENRESTPTPGQRLFRPNKKPIRPQHQPAAGAEKRMARMLNWFEEGRKISKL